MKRGAKGAALEIPWGALAATAFQAGASAAYKARTDPGPWMGKKGTKVATAALTAAVVDTLGKKFNGDSGKMKRWVRLDIVTKLYTVGNI
jgi:hypothetical protein